MPIVQPDDNTYSLWYFDESSHATQLVDSAGTGAALNTIDGGYTKAPRVDQGPNGIGQSLVCTVGQGNYAVETGSAGAHNVLFTGEGHTYTISCFARQDFAVEGDIFSYGDGVEGHSKISFFVGSDGKLGFNFEYDEGTDVTIRQTGGSGLTLGVWSHIAVFVLNPVLPIPPDNPGFTGSVAFYIDGIGYPGGIIGTTELHDSNAFARFGLFTNFQAYNPFQGALKDIKITNPGSLDSYIAADAATITTTAEQVLDSATKVLYRLQDAADGIDEMGKLHLRAQGQLDIIPNRPLTSDVSPIVRSKLFNGATTATLVGPVGPHSGNIGLATVLRGTCSLDFWIRSYPESATAQDHGIFLLNDQGAETQAANFFAVGLLFNSTSDGYSINYQWETGTGTDRSYATPNNTITYFEMNSGRGIHIGCVKEVSGSNFTVKTYVNGVLMDTSTSLVNYDGTMNTAGAVLTLGAAYGVGLRGQLDEIRVSTVARTLGDYQAIYAAGGGNIVVPPPGSRYGTGGEI